MLRVDRKTGKLTKLKQTTLSDASIGERSGLQELILQNVSAFFEQECNETLFLIAEEVEPSREVSDRIDLLAIDEKGRAVIIELKRGSHKLHLLQSLTYAAMIADWDQQEFEKHLPSAQRTGFQSFTAEFDSEKFNEFQRVILVAEAFGFETLKTAEWLTEQYGLNITCYQINLAQEDGDGPEYLSAMQLFPPRKLASQARRRGAIRSERSNKFADIEELLGTCNNPDVEAYFLKSLTDVRRNRRRDSLVYPQTGQMRFRVRPKNGYARVSQLGRFEGDEGLWKAKLSDPVTLPKANGMRFRLTTKADIDVFIQFTNERLPKTQWTYLSNPEDDGAVEDED